MPLATLSIDLVAKLANLEQGMDKAGRIAEKQAAQIEAAFAGLKSAATTLGAALGGAFSVEAIKNYFKAAIDGLDKLNDLKDATGATIENISALEDVAVRTGTSFENMATALVKLNKVLNDAKPGSETAGVLQAIGLSAEELRRIDPAEAMLKVAQALATFSDDGNKARAVQLLFGKSIQEVAPLLKDLAEKGKLNATVTKEQAEAAEKFNNQLHELQKNSIDTARAIAGPLISALNDFIAKLKEVNAEGGTVGERQIRILESLGILNADSDAVKLGKLNEQIANTKRLLKEDSSLTGSERSGYERTVSAAEAQRAALLRRIQTKEALALGAGVGADPGLRSRSIAVPSGQGGKGEKAKHGIDGLPLDRQEAFRQLEREAEAAVNAAFSQARLADVEADRINRLKLEAETINAASEAQQRLNDALQAMIDATPTAKLEETRREMLALADAFEKGQITAQQFTEAAQTRLGTLPEKFKDAVDQMDEFSKQAAHNIQNALGDTVFDMLSGKFDDIGARWGNLLKRMAAEAIAAQIGHALFGDFGKTGVVGGLGGAALKGIGSLFGIPSFDVGTSYVPRDTLAMVHKGERITPASQNRGGAGGMVINNNQVIQIDGRLDQTSTVQLVGSALEANNRALEARLASQGR